ncbi:MAG: hypothetical protein IMY72_13135 [Bacteroidetes bacterium]|nr:hypothetical protein [Bacteroidota bacterium]
MKVLKKIGIALLVLFFVLIIVLTISLWYIFTPEKLTPLINKQAKEYLTCNTKIEKVEPSFFSTYPFFGLEIINLCLTENTNLPNADTLLNTPKCLASVNAMSYLFKGNISLNLFFVEDGYLNFKIDSLGNSNFDIFKISTDSTEVDSTSEELELGEINISNVEFKNFNAKYTDESSSMKADIKNLNANLELKYNEEKQYFDFDMQLNRMLFITSDSTNLYIDAKNCDIKINSKAKDKNLFDSDIKFVCNDISVSMAGDKLLSNIKFASHLPFNIQLSENICDFKESKFIINDEQQVLFGGQVKMLNDDSIFTNIKYSTNELDIEKIIALIPEAYSDYLKDIKTKGYAQVSGAVKGIVSETNLPVITTNLKYYKGKIKYTGYPSVNDIKLSLSTKVDMNKNQSSDVTINSSYAKILNSSVSVKGNISNMLEAPVYNIYTNGNYTLADFNSFIPKEQNVIVRGKLKVNMHARFSQSDIDNEKYHRIYLNSDFKPQNFYAIYEDSIKVDLPSGNIEINLPGNRRADKNLVFANIKFDAPKVDIEMSPTMSAASQNLELNVDINNMVKELSAPITKCSIKFGSLYAIADTLSVKANNTNGEFKYIPTLKSKKEIAVINSTINSKEIIIAGNDSVMFDAKKLYAKTNLNYDESQKNIMLQLQPEVDISFSDATYDLSGQLKGDIPNISFTLNPDTMEIKKANLILGDSDFSLSGELTNISKYINEQALLKGHFDLVSKRTDVYQLMDIFNGMGSQDSTLVENEDITTEDDPFMVPKGIAIRLNTRIDKTVVNDNIIENIKGGLTVKDGTLILDQMGFTTKAANMQLTAMYRSKRKNHLFTSIDFHLLDIDVAELIELIPSVDTIIPMLKSFKGKGEFHLAGETYLKSDYSLKQSTIRGAVAFEGQDLVLMDSEIFDMIASNLKFEKKTENIIDSLSVEMTLYKDEIDLYPFLIVMDDYKAVISGRHNTDNHFNYHISVTDTPLPVRLGLNVKGTVDDLKYELAPCKYKHLYNPEKQGAMEARTLRLKKLISDSLKENVKEVKE